MEHDASFIKNVVKLVSGHANVHLYEIPAREVSDDYQGAIFSEKRGFNRRDFADYVDQIVRVGGKFDVIVIDGRARLACLDRALTQLNPDGIIVFDNIRRGRYASARDMLKHQATIFWGLTPCLPIADSTAIIRINSRPTRL